MSLLTGLKLTDATAVLAASKNASQRRLIRDVPTMIECLIIMVNFNITSGKTRDMLVSFLSGYNTYGRLRPNMLTTLQDVILQNASRIQEVIDNAHTQTTQVQREPGDESDTKPEDHLQHNEPDDDPFA